MDTLFFLLCIISMMFYINISRRSKDLNKLSVVNIIICSLVYFIHNDAWFVFLVLLNSSYSYCTLFKEDIRKSKEFLSFVELFKNKMPNEEYQTITKNFFNQHAKIEVYNCRIRRVISAINIISLMIAIFITLRNYYGL